MIKLENVVLASPEQMEFIIQGMRNPMNSWEKSDSGRGCDGKLCGSHCAFSSQWCGNTPKYVVGEANHSLMQRLSNAGTEHRKYLRMMPVYVRITAPLYWWKEFDTYKVGTVANSCSTMHKIAEKEFTLEDFSMEHVCIRQSMDVLKNTIDALNVFRDVYLNGGNLRYENGNIKCFGKKDKEIWWQMIQLLPSSYTSTVNRGREIVHRETDPQFSGEPTNRQVKDYATSLLSQLSSVEYTISYSHGYCPVRLYDCVRLNYERAGLMDIKAKVTRQSIECKPGCKVTETAVFTTNLWR